MTEYHRCDDCDKWADVETMDRFSGNLQNVLVCKTCSEKKRGIVPLTDDNWGNAEDKNPKESLKEALKLRMVLCHYDGNGQLVHVDETLKSAIQSIDAKLFGKDGEG